MTAGARNRKIVIERRVAGKDAAGQALEQWAVVVATYAEIKPQSGRELNAGGAIVSSVAAFIDIRYRTGVTAAMRVRYGSRIFAIEAVMDLDLSHTMLRLVCSEDQRKG